MIKFNISHYTRIIAFYPLLLVAGSLYLSKSFTHSICDSTIKKLQAVKKNHTFNGTVLFFSAELENKLIITVTGT